MGMIGYEWRFETWKLEALLGARALTGVARSPQDPRALGMPRTASERITPEGPCPAGIAAPRVASSRCSCLGDFAQS